MMVMPSKEELKMHEIIDPWLEWDADKERPVLKSGAPKEAQDMYKVFWQKYGKNYE